MKLPYSWILCFVLMILVIYLSVTNGYTDEDLQKMHDEKVIQGKQMCNDNKLFFIDVMPRNFTHWKTLCYLQNPVRFFEYEVE